jgi:hypothetical protein
MKVALTTPEKIYDYDKQMSWKRDIEKGFSMVKDEAWVPSGGGANAILMKTDARNYNTRWSDSSDVAVRGTWTPTFFGLTTAGTPSYITQVGYYRVLSDMVFYNYLLVAGLTGAVGPLFVGGFPFNSTTLSAGSNYNINTCRWTGFVFPAGYTQLITYHNPGTTNMGIQRCNNAGLGADNVYATEITGNVTLMGSGMYWT